jgi:hypothetical protein
MVALKKADRIVSSVIVIVKGEQVIDVEKYKLELSKIAQGEVKNEQVTA